MPTSCRCRTRADRGRGDAACPAGFLGGPDPDMPLRRRVVEEFLDLQVGPPPLLRTNRSAAKKYAIFIQRCSVVWRIPAASAASKTGPPSASTIKALAAGRAGAIPRQPAPNSRTPGGRVAPAPAGCCRPSANPLPVPVITPRPSYARLAHDGQRRIIASASASASGSAVGSADEKPTSNGPGHLAEETGSRVQIVGRFGAAIFSDHGE